LEEYRVQLLDKQKNKTTELTEAEIKRAEESKKFYTSAISLSTQYNDALLAEYGSTKLSSDALKKLKETTEDAFKLPEGISASKASQMAGNFWGAIALASAKKRDKALQNIGNVNVDISGADPVASEEDKELLEQNNEVVKDYAKNIGLVNSMVGMLGSTFQSAFEGMLNSGKVSFKGIIDGLKALIVRLLAAVATAMLLVAVMALATGGANIAAAGGFLKAVKPMFFAMSGIPKFAEGGMVNGLTMAVLGDNPSGKEAVIPFEKMGSFLSQYGTGGNQNMRVEVVGRLQGEDIYFSGLNYSNGRNKIIGG